MTCRDIRELLDVYVEGELHPTEVTQVESHLGTCSDCRWWVTHLQQMSHVLALLPTELPAPELTGRILAHLNSMVPARHVSWRSFLPVALGACFATLVMLWLGMEALTALQEGGGLEFLALFSLQPETMLSYPSEALAALIEALPVVEFLLMLAALSVALFLGQRAIALMMTGHTMQGHGMHMNGRA